MCHRCIFSFLQHSCLLLLQLLPVLVEQRCRSSIPMHIISVGDTAFQFDSAHDKGYDTKHTVRAVKNSEDKGCWFCFSSWYFCLFPYLFLTILITEWTVSKTYLYSPPWEEHLPWLYQTQWRWLSLGAYVSVFWKVRGWVIKALWKRKDGP